MADGSELKDELAVLVQHVQRFFVEDCRPWAEVRYTLFIASSFDIPAVPCGRSFVLKTANTCSLLGDETCVVNAEQLRTQEYKGRTP